MKRLIVLLLITTPAISAEYAWKCPDGSILPEREKPCPGALRKNVDDMSAAEINAYLRATSEDARLAHQRAKAEESRVRIEEGRREQALSRLCAGIDRLPVIGMTEEQYLSCTSHGRPVKKNYTQTAFGMSVQYVYTPGSIYRFVYFTNGRLTALQD